MSIVVKDTAELIGNTPLLHVNNINTGLCNLYLKLESFNLSLISSCFSKLNL